MSILLFSFLLRRGGNIICEMVFYWKIMMYNLESDLCTKPLFCSSSTHSIVHSFSEKEEGWKDGSQRGRRISLLYIKTLPMAAINLYECHTQKGRLVIKINWCCF